MKGLVRPGERGLVRPDERGLVRPVPSVGDCCTVNIFINSLG